MRKSAGFSLIEIVVVMGILALLVSGAVFIGFPEYNRYSLSAEREYLVDALMESRTKTFASDKLFTVSTWTDGYCIKDDSDLCVRLEHKIPENMTLSSEVLATSTKIILGINGASETSGLKTEINIDQNGFIDGR